jgi:glyceraldehyde-3-phosphate dehydrogenase/erythrose-4-phosphate dehydrogenase
MRTLILTVPDTDNAESTIRKVARQLCDGDGVAVLPVPFPLGLDHALAVAQVIDEAQVKLRGLACAVSVALAR